MPQRKRSRSGSVRISGKVDTNPWSFRIRTNEVFSDFVTPGYFKMVREGAVLPMNEASGSSRKVISVIDGDWGTTYHYPRTSPPLMRAAVKGASAMAHWGNKQPTFSAPNYPVVSEHDVSVLYTEALAKAKTQGMDILTFYAEFQKTLDMVTGVATRVLKRAHDIVRVRKLSRIKDRKAFISAFSDSWLEYRYGWRVLAYDIEDIQELIAFLHNGLSVRLKAKGKSLAENVIHNSSGVSESITFPSVGSSGSPYRHIWKDEEYHGVRSHAGVLIESYMRSAVTVDPILTLYELTPYSFVVDWLFNVNQWLSAMSPLLDERILQAYKRIDYYRLHRWEVGPVTAPFEPWDNQLYVPFGTSSSITMEEVSWSRTLLSSGEQQLTLAYVNNFDRLKAADALALLWGRVRALRRFTSI